MPATVDGGTHHEAHPRFRHLERREIERRRRLLVETRLLHCAGDADDLEIGASDAQALADRIRGAAEVHTYERVIDDRDERPAGAIAVRGTIDSTTQKIAVFAPMPSARTPSTTAVNRRSFAILRKAQRMSDSTGETVLKASCRRQILKTAGKDRRAHEDWLRSRGGGEQCDPEIGQ